MICHRFLSIAALLVSFAPQASAAGSLVCDSAAITSTPKSREASPCTFAILEEGGGLYDMASFTFGGLDDEEPTMVVYTKTQATLNTFDDGSSEVVWMGTVSSGDGGFGLATLVQNTNGDVSGTFNTLSSAFAVTKLPSGALRVKETYWEDALETGTDVEAEGGAAQGRVDGGEETLMAAEMVVARPKSQSEVVSTGEGVAIQDSAGNRMLREQDRGLQSYADIHVLVIITNAAMCESAGL